MPSCGRSGTPVGRQASQGTGGIRQQLRLVLKHTALPPQGTLIGQAYAYVREHY